MATSPTFVFPVWDIPSIPVVDKKERFPVRRVFCVGRNYAAHVKEMGGSVDKQPPVFFTKSPDSVVPEGGGIHYALATQDLHYEIELVVCIGKEGTHIPPSEVINHIYGYCVGLDMTRRDIQRKVKAAGEPWDTAKQFEEATPLSAVVPRTGPVVAEGCIWLRKNGTLVQEANLNEMILSVPELLSQLSALYTLKPGDVFMTGTPSGVGPVTPGDHLEGGVDGIGSLTVDILPPLHPLP